MPTRPPSLEITNKDPNALAGGAYTDASQVEKFELTEQEYESRRGPSRRSVVILSARWAFAAGPLTPRSCSHI